MRRWMMAGGAAVLMALGSAHAVVGLEKGGEQYNPSSRTASATAALRDTNASDATRVTASDLSEYITREEFLKYYGAVLDRIERDEKARQVSEPTFTDAG